MGTQGNQMVILGAATNEEQALELAKNKLPNPNKWAEETKGINLIFIPIPRPAILEANEVFPKIPNYSYWEVVFELKLCEKNWDYKWEHLKTT